MFGLKSLSAVQLLFSMWIGFALPTFSQAAVYFVDDENQEVWRMEAQGQGQLSLKNYFGMIRPTFVLGSTHRARIESVKLQILDQNDKFSEAGKRHDVRMDRVWNLARSETSLFYVFIGKRVGQYLTLKRVIQIGFNLLNSDSGAENLRRFDKTGAWKGTLAPESPLFAESSVDYDENHESDEHLWKDGKSGSLGDLLRAEEVSGLKLALAHFFTISEGISGIKPEQTILDSAFWDSDTEIHLQKHRKVPLDFEHWRQKFNPILRKRPPGT